MVLIITIQSGSQTAYSYFLHVFREKKLTSLYTEFVANEFCSFSRFVGRSVIYKGVNNQRHRTQQECNLPSDGENFSKSYSQWLSYFMGKNRDMPLNDIENKQLKVIHVSWHPLVATYIK